MIYLQLFDRLAAPFEQGYRVEPVFTLEIQNVVLNIFASREILHCLELCVFFPFEMGKTVLQMWEEWSFALHPCTRFHSDLLVVNGVTTLRIPNSLAC